MISARSRCPSSEARPLSRHVNTLSLSFFGNGLFFAINPCREAHDLVKVFPRCTAGARRGLPRGRGGHGARPAGAQRRRQDGRRAHPLHHPRALLGRATVLGPRRGDPRRTPSGASSAWPASTPRSTRTSPAGRTSRWWPACSHLSRPVAARRATELLEEFGLSNAGDPALKTYSGGMRRRLDLAAALVANLPVLFLDEPTTGLDPQSRQGLWAAIEELVRRGHDGAVDHAVPRGGGPAGPRHRGHRPRAGPSPRDAGTNQGRPGHLGGLGHAGRRPRRWRQRCRLLTPLTDKRAAGRAHSSSS